jgi:hypothetical protein
MYERGSRCHVGIGDSLFFFPLRKKQDFLAWIILTRILGLRVYLIGFAHLSYNSRTFFHYFLRLFKSVSSAFMRVLQKRTSA